MPDYQVRRDMQAQGLVGMLKGDEWIQPGRNDPSVGWDVRLVTPGSLSHSCPLINENVVSHECLGYRTFRFHSHSEFVIQRTKAKPNQTFSGARERFRY